MLAWSRGWCDGCHASIRLFKMKLYIVFYEVLEPQWCWTSKMIGELMVPITDSKEAFRKLSKECNKALGAITSSLHILDWISIFMVLLENPPSSVVHKFGIHKYLPRSSAHIVKTLVWQLPCFNPSSILSQWAARATNMSSHMHARRLVRWWCKHLVVKRKL